MNANIKFLLLSLNLFIYFSCFSLFYHPTRREYFPPHQFSLKYKDIFYKNRDNLNLHGYYFFSSDKSNTKNSIIVYFHGNAQNSSSHYLGVYWLTEYGYDIIVWDYRGFGKSEGDIDHIKNFFDIEELISYSIQIAKEQNRKIILWGQSLGGALLITSLGLSELKNNENIIAIIIDSTFDSYSRIIDYHSQNICILPFRPIAKSLYSETFSPDKFLGFIKKPTVFIYGTNDPVVPYFMGLNLYQIANSPRIFISVYGGYHSNWQLFGKSPASKKIISILDTLSFNQEVKDEFIQLPFIN